MLLFFPDVEIKSVLEIDRALLNKIGVRALILDADNTLLTYGSKTPGGDVLEWLEYIRKQNIPMLLVSNNRGDRIAPLAENLKMEYFSFSCKPLPFAFFKAKKRFGLKRHDIGVVGDQIFTDILGGNLYGFKTILVEPLELEEGKMQLFKRKLERPFRKNRVY